MCKTPEKFNIQIENKQFSPIIVQESPLASPQRNLTGTLRIAKDLAANLYNTIQKWNNIHINGATIVKEIASHKANNNQLYSKALEELSNGLCRIINELRIVRDNLLSLQKQSQSLVKLNNKSEDVSLISLNAETFCSYMDTVVDSYVKEFEMKQFILENIPHTKSEDDAMFFAACWVHQVYIKNEANMKLEALLADTGHRKC